MQIDTQIITSTIETSADDARRAEAQGFDGIWTTEAGHDPLMPLTLMAQATERVALGTSIAVAFGRSPMAMAQAAWDVQRLSKGRLRLGLGTQVRAHVERRYSMPYDHPVARLVDYVGCMRAIWHNFQTGEKPKYEGEFYRFTLMNPLFGGGPIDHPDVQVHFAGVNPKICRAAGEVADGFHVHPMHSIPYLEQVVFPALREGAAIRNRTLEDLEIYGAVFTVTGDTQEAWDRSLEYARSQLAFYGSTPAYRVILETHDQGALARELSESARKGEWKTMGKKIPDALLEQIAVIAKPAELPAAVRARSQGVLDRLSIYFGIAEDPASPEVTKFIEAFRAADTTASA